MNKNDIEIEVFFSDSEDREANYLPPARKMTKSEILYALGPDDNSDDDFELEYEYKKGTKTIGLDDENDDENSILTAIITTKAKICEANKANTANNKENGQTNIVRATVLQKHITVPRNDVCLYIIKYQNAKYMPNVPISHNDPPYHMNDDWVIFVRTLPL